MIRAGPGPLLATSGQRSTDIKVREKDDMRDKLLQLSEALDTLLKIVEE
jgi:hypothetical protein